MLVGALACPHPPLLLPGLTGGADVAAELRAAIRDGLKALAATEPELVILVGSADRTWRWDPGSPRCTARFSARRVSGADVAGAATRVLPLSLSVGQELLDATDWPVPRELVSVAATTTPDECLDLGRELAAPGRRLALLVLGDGSARRSEKAPGYLDPRAAGYDEQVRRGLAGDPAALRTLDPALGAELLAAGRAPWQVLAGAARAGGGAISSQIHYADDPFGVYYVVSSWAIA